MSKRKSVSFDGGPVGYKRPPAEHQFKPGQKPKGSGRRKGTRNTETIVDEILNLKVTITEGGKRRRVRVMEALLKKALAGALGGSPRDITKFIDLVERLAPRVLPENQPIPVHIIPGDETI